MHCLLVLAQVNEIFAFEPFSFWIKIITNFVVFPGQVEHPVSAQLSGEKSLHQQQQQHIQQHTEQRPRPPLPITSPKKPITQAEFQALVDAGYKVQAIPVPVPVPVSAEKYKQLQYQPAQRGIVGQPIVGHSVGGGAGAPLHHAGSGQPHTRQAPPTHYIRYHPKQQQQQQESEEGILTSYLRPLIDYIGGPAH